MNNLMSRFEDTMEVLGIPNHEPRTGEDAKGPEPEQNGHDMDLIGLPGRQVTDQARASETLSKIRAHFQNVSCLLHASHGCSRDNQTYLQPDRQII